MSSGITTRWCRHWLCITTSAPCIHSLTAMVERRALEALVLRRDHLKDTLFVAMSNYYYDEKDRYLASLSEVRRKNHDLMPFIKFGLVGISAQRQRLLREIRTHVQRSLFHDVMGQMYGRLRSTRKRALAQRQYEILNRLLELNDEIEYTELFRQLERHYGTSNSPVRAYVRDLNHLSGLRAIFVRRTEALGPERPRYWVSVRLEWATEITETVFFQRISQLPKAKNPSHCFWLKKRLLPQRPSVRSPAAEFKRFPPFAVRVTLEGVAGSGCMLPSPVRGLLADDPSMCPAGQIGC